MKNARILPYAITIFIIIAILALILLFVDHPIIRPLVVVEGKIIQVDEDNYQDSPGLASAQKLHYIRLALADPHIKELVTLDNATTSVGKVTGEEWDPPEYVNSGFSPVHVPVVVMDNYVDQWNNSGIGRVNANMVTVDRRSDKVCSVDIGNHRNEPLRSYVIIPPGASWSHPLSEWYGDFDINVTYRPPDTKVYVLVLDQENYTKYANNIPYEPLIWTGLDNRTYCYNGMAPIESGTNISVYVKGPAKMFVIRNGEANKDISISIDNYFDYPLV